MAYTRQHTLPPDAARLAVQRANLLRRRAVSTEVIRSPGRKFPTLIQTRLGLDVTVNNIDNGHAGWLQEQRLVEFLMQDDAKAYTPAKPGNPYAVRAGWHEVDSTALGAVKWDPDRQSLTVEFHNRARYRYDQVPERIVHELLHAPSVGSYFEGQIKRHYASTRLPE